jgi:hypothetical protein
VLPRLLYTYDLLSAFPVAFRSPLLIAQERMARREHIQPVGLQELEDQLQMANEASPY